MEHKDAVKLIQNHLRTFSHQARDVTDIPGLTYDILVNGKDRIKVFQNKMLDRSNAGAMDLREIDGDGCDIVAIVVLSAKKAKTTTKLYARSAPKFTYTDFLATPTKFLTTE